MQQESLPTTIPANSFWYASLKTIFYLLIGFNFIELAGLGYIFFCRISYSIRWKWIYLNSYVGKSDTIIRTVHEILNFLAVIGIVILFYRLLRIIRKMGFKPLVKSWLFFSGLIVPMGFYIMQYLIMRDFVKKSGEKLNASDVSINRSLQLLQPWAVLILLFAIIVYTIQFKVLNDFSHNGISAQIYLLTIKAILGGWICVVQNKVFGMLQNWNKKLSNQYISFSKQELQDDQLLDN